LKNNKKRHVKTFNDSKIEELSGRRMLIKMATQPQKQTNQADNQSKWLGRN